MANESLNTISKLGIITTFLVLGTYNRIFVLAAFLGVAVLIVKDNNAVAWLVYLNSFSAIFKLSPTGQSMTIILIILYVLYSVYQNHELSRTFVIRLIMFGVIVLVSSASNYDIARIVKFFFGIIFVYYALSHISIKSNVWTVLKYYIWGVVISSAVAYSGIINNSSAYLVEKTLGYVDAYQSRFAGMYSDPNYYVVNIIIAICLLEILGINKKISKIHEYGLLMVLVLFSFLTLSKSAIIMLFIPIFVIIIYCFQIKDYKKLIGVFGLLAIVLMIIFNLNIPQLATILGRFSEAQDINSLTTGRFYIWNSYFDYFNANAGKFIFGSGVGATLVNNRAAHNTYIDFVFYFGVIGSVLFLYLIAYFNKREYMWKRSVINYSVYISITLAYMALSETFYFDFPIHILLAAIVFRLEDFIVRADCIETLQESC